MSCDSRQRQIAQTAATSGGISPGGNKTAGLIGQTGGVGVKPSRKPKRREVRQAVKSYHKLPAAKKEKLQTLLGEAALAGKTNEEQRRLLKRAVREFGLGVTAAGLAVELSRFKKNEDDWSRQKYEPLAAVLAGLRPAAATKSDCDEPKPDEKTAGKHEAALPTQHQIIIGGDFTPQELDRLQTSALLSGAATRRQLEALRLNAARGHGHSDPRAQDWMTQDLDNFRFVGWQLGQARHNGGKLDTAALTEAELVDLWEFSRFEADRALRNVDHLLSGWSHLRAETADYLGGHLRLEARFYSYLAQHLEPRITLELRDRYQAWDVAE